MAAGNNAFSLQGATPYLSTSNTPASTTTNTSTSPYSKALTTATAPQNQAPAPTATTPLKRTTTNNVDGSSTSYEYHAPAAPGSPEAAAAEQKKDVQKYFPGMMSGGSSNPTSQTPTTPTTPTNPTTPATPATPQTPYQQVTGGLIDKGTNEAPQLTEARENLKDFKLARAGTEANIAGNPNLSLDTKQGLGQIIANRAASELPAYQDAVTSATTSQGQGITALGTAGGLIPEALRFGGQGGGLDPSTAAQGLAQKVVNGQMTYDDAAASLGYAGSAGQQFLNNAIQSIKPGFNIPVSRGQAAANQANTTTSGTAGVNAASAGIGQATQDTQAVRLQVQNVEDLGNLLVSTGEGNQVNPLQFAPANQVVNDFKKSLSSEGQIRFDSSLKAFAGAASQLLTSASGQTPTGVTEAIKGIANGSITMGALRGLVDQAKLEGHTKQGNQVSQLINYQSMLKGHQPPNLPGTMTVGGKNYVLSEDGTYNPTN